MKEIKLKNVATIIMGQSPPSATYNIIANGLPFYQGCTDFGFRYPNRRVYCDTPKKIAKKGDILLTVRAPIGRINIADNECAIGRGLSIIRALDEQDQTFLEFALRAKSEHWQILENQGSVFGNAKKEDLENLKICWLSDEERIKIAHILGTLDDKIELNQRMNRTLEAIARAIFKSWFIDFDPVKAKMEGREPVGMSKEVADLFPDSFVDSELGMIPKGWEVKSLPEVMEINPKRSLSKGIKAPYLDMKNMPTQGHRPDFWIEREFNSGVKFINGDTLMARITPCLENGKASFVDFLENSQTGWGSTEYIVFRPKHPLPLEFAYYLVRNEDFKIFSILNMTGSSGRQRTPTTSFNQYLIAICSEEIAIKFGESVKSLMKIISTYSNQSRTLANIRDTLLPKLISGEIRIKEAEKMVKNIV